jgi:hypothetical protein
VADLPEPTRHALTVAACSSTSAMHTIAEALGRLRLSVAHLAPAEDAGLVSIADGLLAWRHPLMRSAIYQRAPASERRAAHFALACSADDAGSGDHRAWHLAAPQIPTTA